MSGVQGEGARSEGPELELWEMSFAGRSVVVGVGNPYMKDDGVGIQVARQLRGLDPNRFFVYEAQAMDMSLLWHFKDARKIVLVDATKYGAPVGTITRYSVSPREGPLVEVPGLHSLQLFDIFDVAHQPGMLPCPLTIIGIEPKDCSPGEGLSEEVAMVLPAAVDAVMDELGTSRSTTQ